MNGNPLVRLATAVYQWIIYFNTTWLQPVFLLAVRLYWGWQFFITGKGKLTDIPKVSGFFHSLGIPFPTLNAYLAGSTECFGGLLLLLGLGCRVTTVPLIFTMVIAYVTASPDAIKNIFHDQDPFFKDDAFTFLAAAVIIFLFGPGPLSLDGLIGQFLKSRAPSQPAGEPARTASAS
jgi:putative oxidoreductase